MADAASTSTLVLVALSGGTGAFLGVALNQVVQLRRDKKQYEREDARHERERQDTLADARTVRRLDGYVGILSALTTVDRQISTARQTVELWGLNHAASQHLGDEAPPALRTHLPELTAQAEADGRQLEADRQALERAIYEAWPLASEAVRKASQGLIYSPFVWSGHMNAGKDPTALDAEPGTPAIEDTPAYRYMNIVVEQLNSYAKAVRGVGDLIRDELRLD